MNKKHVAVDLDDVVLDFVGGLREAVKKEYDIEILDTDITKWDLHPVLDPIIGENWWNWLRDREWLWSHFPAVDGAIGYLSRLRKDGYYLECVTSKPSWAEYNVWRWMGKWRPPFNRVTIVEHEPKYLATDAWIMVDDKPDNLKGFLDTGRMPILYSRSHNLDDVTYSRVETWKETYDLINDFQLR